MLDSWVFTAGPGSLESGQGREEINVRHTAHINHLATRLNYIHSQIVVQISRM